MLSASVSLNLLWIALCACAVILQVRSDLRRSASRRIWMRAGLAVFLVAVTLFPVLSSSDDSARIDYLYSQQGSGPVPQTTEEKALDSLVRLFELVESAQISSGLAIVAAMFFISFIASLRLVSIDRLTPAIAGRAPPAGSRP